MPLRSNSQIAFFQYTLQANPRTMTSAYLNLMIRFIAATIVVAAVVGHQNLLGQSSIECILPPAEPEAPRELILGCGSNNPNVNSGGVLDSKYSKQSFWIPQASTPNLTVPVAIHIFQNATGGGTFIDDPSTYVAMNQIMTWVNATWANIYPPSDPETWQTSISNSKIQFELADRVFFYPNTGLQSTCNLTEKMQYVQTHFPERMKFLGIFSSLPNACGQYAYLPYPNWHDNPAGGAATANGLEGYNGIQMSIGTDPSGFFASAITISHELGHCLDLLHVYEPSCCHETCNSSHREYLSDVFGPSPSHSCWFNTCSGGPDPWEPGNTVTNNIMNGCFLASPGYWMSDLQAGRAHRSLSLKSVKDYTLNSYTTVPLIVASDEIWNFEMRLYQDVIIEPGATLTIQCQLEMPYEGRIIVKPNGRLIVDGGKITTARYSNTFWSGIEAWGTTNMNQYPTNHPNFQGLVVLKNGATIEYAREGFTNWKPNDWNSIGGVIQVQGSHGQVGGVFLNCRRAAGFVAYQNFSPGQSKYTST